MQRRQTMAGIGAESEAIPSLKGAFARDEVSMALTTAGLLPEQTKELVHLYAENLSWEAAGQRWHEERRAGRGSRESAQKILHLIQERLNAAGKSLPSLVQLSELLAATSAKKSTAQVLYLYLIEADPLVRYVLHELLREQGTDRTSWKLTKSWIRSSLDAFRYEDGTSLDYAESTLDRWTQGFRSVLREIGVRESKYADEGTPPPLHDVPLAVAAGYSWRRMGDAWEQNPVGWMYLFQPQEDWSELRGRLRELPAWEEVRTPRGNYLKPVDDPFALAGHGR